MSEPHALERLASPPRVVPWTIQARELFAGPEAMVGWLFVAFGLALACLVAPKMDLTSWYWFRGPVRRAAARVESCWETGAVHAQEFSFVLAGLNYRGVSYRARPCLLTGQPAEVEFPDARPDLARLPGSQISLFGPSAALIFLLPLLGAVLVLAGLGKGLGRVGLLADGVLVTARLAAKKPTWRRVGRDRVYRAVFRFQDAKGLAREVRAEILGDGVRLGLEERFFYDPRRPEAAVFADEILERLSVRGSGEIESRGGAGALLAAAMPALTIAVSAWLLLRRALAR